MQHLVPGCWSAPLLLLLLLLAAAPGCGGQPQAPGPGGLGGPRGESREPLSRTRRSALKKNPDVAGFSWEERVQLVRIHNEKRRLVGASDMRHVTWDTDLEKLAQAWVGDCNTVHSANSYRKTSRFSYAGENLWGGTGGYREEGIVSAWDNEKQYYYSNFTCEEGKVCGHYTQVASAETYAIGCGIKFCGSWYRVACMYGPGGNIGSQHPFTRGSSCSACPSDASQCDAGLCRPGDCYGKTCQNNGQLLQDVCECNCTGSGYTGEKCDTSGTATVRVCSPAATLTILALAALALSKP